MKGIMVENKTIGEKMELESIQLAHPTLQPYSSQAYSVWDGISDWPLEFANSTEFR